MAEDDFGSAAAAFSSNGSEIMSRKAKTGENEMKLLTEIELKWKFDLEETTSWIENGKFSRVALQFPDSLLPYSVRVTEFIERRTGQKVYIMADTSYGSCCVDEITAQHCQADCIVHYGDACLSQPNCKIPVKFVFPKSDIDLQDLEAKITAGSTLVVESISNFSAVMFLYELGVAHCADEILVILHRIFPNANVRHAKPILPDTEFCDDDVILGRELKWSKNSENGPTVSIFIGGENCPFLTLWRLRFPEMTSILIYDPEKKCLKDINSANVNRLFMKRLYLVEKVKDAQVIGIVAGALGVKGHLASLDRIKKLCKNAGKKTYTFSIGKLNVAKISNFALDMDVFVLISCPFGVLLDFSDYYKPIVSPYEVEMALNKQQMSGEWMAGGWSAEISQILKNPISESASSGESETPDVSLVTGKIRATDLNLGKLASETDMQIQIYSAGKYLENRSWKGLEEDLGKEISVELATEGKSGIASGYANELQCDSQQ